MAGNVFFSSLLHINLFEKDKLQTTTTARRRIFHHGLQREDERSLLSSNEDDGLDVFERSDDDESGRDFCFPPQRLNHSLTTE